MAFAAAAAFCVPIYLVLHAIWGLSYGATYGLFWAAQGVIRFPAFLDSFRARAEKIQDEQRTDNDR